MGISSFGLTAVAQPAVTDNLAIVYDFTGSLGNEATFPVKAQPMNAMASVFGRGSGVGTAGGSDYFAARDWSEEEDIDLQDYYSFSITPDPGFLLNLTELELDYRRSRSGPVKWTFRSSLDNFATDLIAPVDFSGVAWQRNRRSDLDEATFFGVTESVEFRIYAYDAESSAGTWQIDNVELRGRVFDLSLDVDGNGEVGLLTDGLLLVRYLIDIRGPELTNLALADNAHEDRDTPEEVAAYLQGLVEGDVLDVDGNGTVGLLTDGLLIVRYLIDIRGSALTDGALAGNAHADRDSPDEIAAYLDSLVPSE